MTTDVREAKPEDAYPIAKMHIASWQDAYKGIVDQAWLNSRKLDEEERKWHRNLNHPDRQRKTSLAFIGNDLAAFATAGKSRNDEFADYAELWAIYANPQFYGRGAGSAVFNAAVSYVKSLGLTKLFVNVLRDNPRGRHFYERIGGELMPESENMVTLGERDYSQVRYYWKEI